MEYRRNLLTREWVVYGPEIVSPKELIQQAVPRNSTADLFSTELQACPYCPSPDDRKTHDIFSVNETSLSPGGFPRDSVLHTSNWDVRVAPATPPIFRLETDLDRHPRRLHDVMVAPGAHEKISLTAQHAQPIWDLSCQRIELLLYVLRHRMMNLSRDPRLGHQYAYMVYGHHVGGLYNHSVLNLTVSPFIPRKVRRELDGAHQWFNMKDRCLLSDIYEEEIYKRDRGQPHGVIFESRNFVAIMPYFSGHPFETWILPLGHFSDFMYTHVNLLPELSRVTSRIMSALKASLGPFPFILSLMNQPNEAWGVNRGYWKTIDRDWLWRFRIIPDLPMIRSPFKAFHSGTGARLNPVFPEEAAAFVRKNI